jgi:Secretion system C-terminal sorting domain
MLKIKYPRKGFNINWCLLVFWTFLPAFCYSQVLNRSFEVDGQPSLNHWIISCEDGESFQDSPVDGGGWCLRIPEGNFQGCSPEIAHQIIPEFKNGEIWQISVWARQYENKISQTSLYLKIFHTIGDSTVLSADTTTSIEWIRLIIVDTLHIEEGDSVAIILDAGNTSGPQLIDSYSYFDLVEVKKIGEIVVKVNNNSDLLPKEFKLFQNFPNPFNPSTQISFSIPKDDHVNLSIYDVLGTEVAILKNGYLTAGNYSFSFDASNLKSGIYFYTIKSDNFNETKKMLMMK